ncbi:MAG: methylated-DNA--[protein]-cysteine S-methyltransferase [Desulfobacteraceae bacterium]
MYYTRFNTRICEILLVGDEKGLARLHLNTGEGGRQFKINDTWIARPDFFEYIKAQVMEYLDGKRRVFAVDLNTKGTDFQKAVWEGLRKIPYGRRVTYGDIAKALGKKKACRAVGGACGKNPVPLITPCHRVIGANGNLTGFGSGLAIKKKLIALEKGSAPFLRG